MHIFQRATKGARRECTLNGTIFDKYQQFFLLLHPSSSSSFLRLRFWLLHGRTRRGIYGLDESLVMCTLLFSFFPTERVRATLSSYARLKYESVSSAFDWYYSSPSKRELSTKTVIFNAKRFSFQADRIIFICSTITKCILEIVN